MSNDAFLEGGEVYISQSLQQFSVFLDIFYPPSFRCFEGNGVFQHPQALSLIDPGTGERMVNE
jgi:hypothetical protein